MVSAIDEGYGVTDVANLVLRKNWIGRAGERIDFKVEQARQIAEFPDVVGGQHRADARHAAGLADVEGEFRVRMRRAQHKRVHRG